MYKAPSPSDAATLNSATARSYIRRIGARAAEWRLTAPALVARSLDAYALVFPAGYLAGRVPLIVDPNGTIQDGFVINAANRFRANAFARRDGISFPAVLEFALEADVLLFCTRPCAEECELSRQFQVRVDSIETVCTIGQQC